MSEVYIDSEFRCHKTNPDGIYRKVETDAFDGKCDTFIEGCRFVPSGESWTRPDGKVFQGEMKTAWKPYTELDSAQRQYEQALIADMQNALNKLGVTLDE